jgi:type IV secretion system protein VirB9
MMVRSGAFPFALVVAAALSLHSSVSHGEIYPVSGGGDPRIRMAVYSAEQVYRLRGLVGYQIDLEFESGEHFVGLAAGDIEALSFVAQANHLFLKPRAAAIDTNLTVLTNLRHYHFDYTAETRRSWGINESDAIFALRFQYPKTGEPQAVNAASARVDEALKRQAVERPRNIDYWYCGSEVLRPAAASDDGVHTYVRFDPHAEVPAIFVRNEDGAESLLNFSMENGEVIIHRVARRLILRRGALTGCIVNKGYVGSGERLESGTIAPDVQRERRGLAP